MWHRLIPSTLLSVWASSFVVHLHWTEALWTEVAVIHLVSIAFRGGKTKAALKKMEIKGLHQHQYPTTRY